MVTETIRFDNLDELLKFSDELNRNYEYTVAWQKSRSDVAY